MTEISAETARRSPTAAGERSEKPALLDNPVPGQFAAVGGPILPHDDRDPNSDLNPQIATRLSYVHVNLFARRPFTGISLPIFVGAKHLRHDQMLAITRRFRHVEPAFLAPGMAYGSHRLRTFDPAAHHAFAAHAVLSAAAALHHCSDGPSSARWRFEVAGEPIVAGTRTLPGRCFAWLDRDVVRLRAPSLRTEEIAAAFALGPRLLDPSLPVGVVEAGRAHLVVPVIQQALATARPTPGFGAMMRSLGARYAILFDEPALKMRCWDEDGVLHHMPIGAVLAVGAFRLSHGRSRPGIPFELGEAGSLEKSKALLVEAHETGDAVSRVRVGANVRIIACGLRETLV